MRGSFFALALSAAFCTVYASAAEPAVSGVGAIFDRDLTTIEREIVPLAEAMPADKYGFAPTGGEFKGVRTFGQQMKHAAAVIYMVAASVQGGKNPDTGGSESGPETVKTYLKSAFARLSVQGRVQAVLKAQSLGLLPTP